MPTPLKSKHISGGWEGEALPPSPQLSLGAMSQRDKLSLVKKSYSDVPCQCPCTLSSQQGIWSLFPTSSNCLHPNKQGRDLAFGADPAGWIFCSLSAAGGNKGAPVLTRKVGFTSISSCRDCKGSTEFPVIPFSSPGCLHHLYIFIYLYGLDNYPIEICRLLPSKCLQPP